MQDQGAGTFAIWSGPATWFIDYRLFAITSPTNIITLAIRFQHMNFGGT